MSKSSELRNSAFRKCNDYRIHIGKMSAMSPIPNPSPCPSSPGAREPISVVIPFDLLRKNRALMQNANVNHGKANMDKVRRRRLPCVRQLGEPYKGWIVHGAVILSMEGKSDGEAKKKRRKGEGIFYAHHNINVRF
jgi:hypothetical protein